jgi:hypothetical protein
LRQRWRYSVWWWSEDDDDNGGVSCGDNQPAVEERRAGEGRARHVRLNRATQGRKTLGTLTSGWLLLWFLLLLLFLLFFVGNGKGDEVPGGTGTCMSLLAAAMMAAAANGLRTVVRWWK